MTALRLLVIGLPGLAALLFAYAHYLNRDGAIQYSRDAAALFKLMAIAALLFEAGVLLGVGTWTVFSL